MVVFVFGCCWIVSKLVNEDMDIIILPITMAIVFASILASLLFVTIGKKLNIF